MAKGPDLMTVFLGLETLSIPIYVLVGFHRRRMSSIEGALKYFLLGAFASGFLLYGIALMYASTRTTVVTAFMSAAVKAAAFAALIRVLLVALPGVQPVLWKVLWGLAVLTMTVVILIAQKEDEGYDIRNLKGIGFRYPALGALLTLFLVSLGGIPPTAGFVGQFYLFSDAVNNGYLWSGA